MPPVLLILLRRTRTSLLVLLLVVLPLQSIVQLVAGIHGHRHVHTAAASRADVFTRLAQPLRAVLDRLHAAQDARLQAPAPAWVASRGPAAGLHQHGGVYHRHTADTTDAVDLSDGGDDAAHEPGVTAFLAWLPGALAVDVAPRGGRPAAPLQHWRDRVVAPLLAPPRG
ncbi:hypothetical protein [Pelomonas cellulosilytica]|uniref:Secreted protein n=1 Tax=Pelomonas cellulosilytica TaxID=2906762 RepID=A0ABS8XZ46_9BURK|nr:hypothetical protein [Pelomonas sp. P8]MCE4556051.1 hypothetical protein [Pelomonas sp. P8]